MLDQFFYLLYSYIVYMPVLEFVIYLSFVDENQAWNSVQLVEVCITKGPSIFQIFVSVQSMLGEGIKL